MDKKKITQYTRWSTVLLAIVQGYAISSWLMGQSGPSGRSSLLSPGGADSIQNDDHCHPGGGNLFYYVAWRADIRSGHW